MGCICISTQNPPRSQSDISTNGKILAYCQAHLIMMLPTTLPDMDCTPLHKPSSERLQLKIPWNKSRMLFTSDPHCPIYLQICAYITINQIITVIHFSLQIHLKYANSGYFRLKSESLVHKGTVAPRLSRMFYANRAQPQGHRLPLSPSTYHHFLQT